MAARIRRRNRARMTSRGQIVVPARIRRSMRLRKGTEFDFHQDGTRIILQPITLDFIRSLQGCIKPKKGQRSMLDQLVEDHEREG